MIRIFNGVERSHFASLPSGWQTSVHKFTFDPETISVFCNDNDVFPGSVCQLAWCITLGLYVGGSVQCLCVDEAQHRLVLESDIDSNQDVAHSYNSLKSTINSDEAVECNLRSGSHGDTILYLEDEYPTIEGEVPDQGAKLQLASHGRVDDHAVHGLLLRVSISFLAGKITLSLPAGIWHEAGAANFGDLFCSVISLIPSNFHRRFCDIDWMPQSHRKMVHEWNDKELEVYDFDIPSIIADVTLTTPNALAICSWDGDLTYEELEEYASNFAKDLHDTGLNHGEVVPLLFHKSKWHIVALLAVLKAGGAVTTLNPDFDILTLKSIIAKTKARRLLTGDDFHGRLDDLKLTMSTVNRVKCKTNPETLGRNTFISPRLKPEDLAFIQFTSGSTGVPKGVMIEHRTYVANARSQQSACHISSMSRVLQYASHNFDAVLAETITPLMAGACVCIPSEGERISDLAGVCNKLGVNWMGITPTLATVLTPKDVPGIKTLIFWGESASPNLISTWADAVELINVYGPSENSVEATSHSFTSGSRDPSNIGRAMTAVKTWIVRIDNRRYLAPVGTLGELVLQGPTVARGYLMAPEVDGAPFQIGAPWLPPTSQPLHKRLYYTGDLARYTEDGCIQICGRSDRQIKLRGHRHESYDIERHINAQLGENSYSIVEMVPLESRAMQKTLVAFIAGQDTRQQTFNGEVASLKTSLKQWPKADLAGLYDRLCKIMPVSIVPIMFISLNWIPTSASGKTDRKALREAASHMSEEEIRQFSPQASVAELTPPITESEMLAAELWGDVLGIDARSLHTQDSFFWLGGDSIGAMRLTVSARALGLSLAVAQVLQNPRLEDLAVLIRDLRAGEALKDTMLHSAPSESTIKPVDRYAISHRLDIEPEDISGHFQATDYQIDNLAWSLLRQRGGTNYIVFDFRGGHVCPNRLQNACEQLVARHTELRSIYYIWQAQVHQVVLKEISFGTEILTQVRDVEKDTLAIVKSDTEQSLNIGKAVVKFWILKNSGGVQRLIVRASHFQYDGVTFGIWLRELCSSYEGKHMETRPSFAAYMELAANYNIKEAIDYWRDLLAGSSMTNVFEHTRIPYEHVLDSHVSVRIHMDNARVHPDITVASVLKASWALVLVDMSESTDVVFGSVVWGRNAPFPGGESISGACIDNVPVRAQVKPGLPRLRLLHAIQEQYFRTVEFESIGYKRIVRDCTTWRAWERLSTLVEYQNLGDQGFPTHIDGQSLTVDEIRPPADRHDIAIWALPDEDQMLINLWFCKAIVGERIAQQMLNRLMFHLRAFQHGLHEPIMVVNPGHELLPHIPLAPNGSRTQQMNHYHLMRQRKPPGNSEMRFHPKTFVDQAWVDILACHQEDLEGYWLQQTPFWDVWGCLIAGAGLSQWYAKAGFDLQVEDILENPDMVAQVALLHEVKSHKYG